MFKMLRSALLLGALLLLAVAAAPGGVRAQSDDDVKTYTIPGDQVFPEGIAYDHDTGDFFVSSTTNGTIYRGNVDDSELKVFLKPGEDGRTTAIGLELDAKGRLWVAGGPTGKAWVYDAASGELFATISTGETGMENVFLNDIAVAPDGAATSRTP
ncbi:MAG: SMP-30/gluconolactonase/LRE family protein [Chloroflexia bacterium]